jgi:hypothetical protein
MGSASTTLVIEPAAASIEVDDLEQTYTGDAIVVQITTNPPGLNLAVSYNGTTDLPVNAGEYLVEVSIDENNYAGEISDTLTVLPAAAAITFDELEQLFTGQALAPVITTDPVGLDLLVSYDGEPTVPVAVGDYLVEASIDENNYAGHVDGFQHRVMPGGSGRPGLTAFYKPFGSREPGTHEIPSGQTGSVAGFLKIHRVG